MMDQFQYESLSTKEAEIRVLDLIPGSGPIRCRLRNVKLSDSPQYEALSYCWGTSTEKKTIYVNEHPLEIGKSLHTALQYLREIRQPRSLWVDAVCINQNDNDEKNVQVPLMYKIYEQTWRVTIWLGASDILTRRAMRVLKVLLEYSHIWPLGDTQVTSEFWRHAEFNLGQTTGRTAKSDRNLTKNWFWDRAYDTLAFHHLWKNPWFTRVWILQEATVCHKAIAKCGHDEIDWVQLMDYCDFHVGFIPFRAAGPVVARLSHTRKHVVDLFMAFAMNESGRATNNRDKIYGILGLVEHNEAARVKVDYSEKASDSSIFMEFTTAILRSRDDLDVLVRCRGDRSFPPDQTLPTWSLCWDCDETQPFYELSFSAHSRGRHPKIPRPNNVCATENSRPQVAFSNDGRILRVMGAHFDEVEVVGIAMPRAGEEYLSTRTIRAYLSWREICNIDSDEVYAPSGEARREVLWRMVQWFDQYPHKDHKNPRFESFDKMVVTLTHLLPLSIFGIGIGICLASIWDVLILFAWGARLCSDPTWLGGFTGGCGRTIVRTSRGYIGLGPPTIRPGDRIYLLSGSKAPLSLRPYGDRFKVIGETYVHGIMSGEAWDNDKCHEISLE